MKYRHFLSRIFLVSLIMISVGYVSAPQSQAQGSGEKHPRVAELEEKLSTDASQLVKSRFPDVPFLVTVRVEPVHRYDRGRGADSERLPYLDIEEEELRDEWDDPRQTLHSLMSRIRRAEMTLSLPDSLKEVEVEEIKETVFASLHLIPGRDEIKITRKGWKLAQVPWYLMYLLGSLLVALLAGLLMINRNSANRIAHALSEFKGALGGSGGSANSAPPPALMPVEDKSGEKSQDLRFNDPIKLKEIALHHVERLEKTKGFPAFFDMLELDQFGRKNSKKLGAILQQFPQDMQNSLFALSYHDCWLEALNEPGNLDFDCIELLQKLVSHDRSHHQAEWDKVLTAVWRLDRERATFLKTLSRDEAFAVFHAWPKSLAVADARKIYPGNWAAVLDSQFAPKIPAEKRSAEICQKAFELKPLNNIAIIKKYRSDKELLEYLRTADVSEEKEIYEASSKDSLITRIRPPFFKVFAQEDGDLEYLARQVTVDVWALALFNTQKGERKRIDTKFNEKQKFLFIERLKRFDQFTPEKEQVGLARESIARTLNQYLEDKARAVAIAKNSKDLKDNKDNVVNAASKEAEKKSEKKEVKSETGKKAA